MLLNRDRANEIMDREGLDALIAVTPNNVVYMSDYDTDFIYDVPWLACAILPRSPDIAPCLITTEIEAVVLHERPTWMPDLRLYYFGIYGGVLKVHTFAKDVEFTKEEQAMRRMVDDVEKNHYVGVFETAVKALQDMGLTKAKLGFDDTRFADVLGEPLKDATITDATNLLFEIRMVKTPDEIEILRTSAQKNEKAMKKAFAAIHEGGTWGDVVIAYEVGVAEQGGRVLAAFNGAGRKSAGAGRVFKDYPIAKGDQVCFDSMMRWRRYMGDCQRTVVLGEPSEKMETYWKGFKAGAEACYGSMRPGLSTGDLRNQAIETVRKNGCPPFELAFIHGIGLDHIEVPFIAGGTLGDFPIEENMVLNMDFELHEVGWGGMFFEESMLITKNGAERLYTLPRDLIRL
ncbi:MAG: M24 family metallopeptidase [Rhodospirillaceae bacterium]|jgi:Xaa-Pro dipeptidase|nr:M24 family metallopeptidase [Rhodospirillaceae bacterium]